MESVVFRYFEINEYVCVYINTQVTTKAIDLEENKVRAVSGRAWKDGKEGGNMQLCHNLNKNF